MKSPYKNPILLVEDHPFAGALAMEVLDHAGYKGVDWCKNFEEVQKIFSLNTYSAVVLDHAIGHHTGLNVLDYMRAQHPEVPIIFLTDTGNVDEAVEAMRHGAFDVLQKPIHPEKLPLLVQKALDYGYLRTEIIRLKKEKPAEEYYHGLVGKSPAMKKIYDLIERIRGSSVNILITGPSGAGKEMIARAIHRSSPRANQKFVAINCSAIPEALLEGELFGYRKGAFTDARMAKPGLFSEAHQGTIMLDEIGDMPITIQPKILRALQEKEIRPLGATQVEKVDVRIIAATNHDLKMRMEQKLFREDLYYRLNAMQIELPALKDRKEDIPLFVDYFLENFQKMHNNQVKGISQSALKMFIDYSWPGNVRELENTMERAMLLAKTDLILPEDIIFSADTAGEVEENSAIFHDATRPLDDIEKEYIIRVLKAVDGNRSEAAQVLKIGRKTLYNKLAKYGIE
ncbi:sigma-54 dependent transcriptional regulator [bacterium]|nr:sigma-54 dependent transcriptional regulator [bacterium]